MAAVSIDVEAAGGTGIQITENSVQIFEGDIVTLFFQRLPTSFFDLII